jgi:hypothetical protein
MQRTTITTDCSALLDEAANRLKNGEVFGAYRLLGEPLSSLRDDAAAHGLGESFTAAARGHRLFEIVQQDPYTRRAFQKPRGYAGDAVMLDYVYGGVPPACTSAISRTCFSATTRGPRGLSVLYRRCLLRAYLDTVWRAMKRVAFYPSHQAIAANCKAVWCRGATSKGNLSPLVKMPKPVTTFAANTPLTPSRWRSQTCRVC